MDLANTTVLNVGDRVSIRGGPHDGVPAGTVLSSVVAIEGPPDLVVLIDGMSSREYLAGVIVSSRFCFRLHDPAPPALPLVPAENIGLLERPMSDGTLSNGLSESDIEVDEVPFAEASCPNNYNCGLLFEWYAENLAGITNYLHVVKMLDTMEMFRSRVRVLRAGPPVAPRVEYPLYETCQSMFDMIVWCIGAMEVHDYALLENFLGRLHIRVAFLRTGGDINDADNGDFREAFLRNIGNIEEAEEGSMRDYPTHITFLLAFEGAARSVATLDEDQRDCLDLIVLGVRSRHDEYLNPPIPWPIRGVNFPEDDTFLGAFDALGWILTELAEVEYASLVDIVNRLRPRVRNRTESG
jgi:hypothetical protein